MSGNAEKEEKTKIEEKGVPSRRPTDVLVYCHQEDASLKWPKPSKLSALVVTKTGVVYGAGVNSLVGGSNTANIPMKEGGDTFLQNYEKVDSLSGRNIKKIVVGSGFGVALSSSHEVMVWGKPLTSVNPEELVAFESYVPDKNCSYCLRHSFTDGIVGGISLNYCSPYNKYIKRTDKPPDGVVLKTFIRYHEGRAKLPCYECSKNCSYKTLNDINLQYCASCDLMLEKETLAKYTQNYNVIDKIMRANNERIKDIACVGGFVCMLLESNKLVLRNPTLEFEYTEPTQTDKNSTSNKRVALYGGGERCLFVKSEEGTLYMYECPTNLLNVSYFQLKEIKLPGAVEKACCGSKTTAALLADGSVWFIAADCSTYRLYHNSGVNNFADIAVVTMTDTFLVQTAEEMKDKVSIINVKFAPPVQETILVEFYDFGLDTALREMVCHYPVTPDLISPTPKMAQLYGKPYLADLTIKLADEELPAHSCILFSTSAHFQETFSASKPPPKVLDMSEYNPKAYKYLLKYFYQMKPDDLDAEDLVDLRQIATSYGETALAEAATAKIKSKLSEENVLQILARSKHFDFKDVTNECEKIMRSPTFTDKLIKAAMQNLMTEISTKHE